MTSGGRVGGCGPLCREKTSAANVSTDMLWDHKASCLLLVRAGEGEDTCLSAERSIWKVFTELLTLVMSGWWQLGVSIF